MDTRQNCRSVSKPTGWQTSVLYQAKVFLKGAKFAPLKWSNPTAQDVCLLTSVDWCHRWNWSRPPSQPFWSYLYQRLDSLFSLLCPLGFALSCRSFLLHTLSPCAGPCSALLRFPPRLGRPRSSCSRLGASVWEQKVFCQRGKQTARWFAPPALAPLQSAEADKWGCPHGFVEEQETGCN